MNTTLVARPQSPPANMFPQEVLFGPNTIDQSQSASSGLHVFPTSRPFPLGHGAVNRPDSQLLQTGARCIVVQRHDAT